MAIFLRGTAIVLTVVPSAALTLLTLGQAHLLCDVLGYALPYFLTSFKYMP